MKFMKKLLFLAILSILIPVFHLQAADLPSKVQICLDNVDLHYVEGGINYNQYIIEIRQCYIDNDAESLMPTNWNYDLPEALSNVADCQTEASLWYNEQVWACYKSLEDQFISGQIDSNDYTNKSNACGQGNVLEQFQNKMNQCYDSQQLDSIWDLPVLKNSLETTYSDYNLVPSEAQPDLVACFEQVSNNYDLNIPSAEAENAIAGCFDQFNLKSISNTYKKTAIVVDCAEDSLGVDSLSNFPDLILQTTPKQEAYLEQCVLDKTTPVVAGIALLNIPLAAGGVQTLVYLQFLIFQIAYLFKRKKDVDGGLVYDAFSGQPLDLCVLRLQDVKSSKLKSTFVTGKHGRYLFLPEQGDYLVTAKRDAYTFPSDLKVEQNKNYHGEKIKINQSGDVVNENIPLDPSVKKISALKWNWLKRRDKISLSMAWFAPLYSVGSLFLVQTWWLIAFAVLNLVFLIIFYRLRHKVEAPEFGRVLSADKKPIRNVRVALFEKTKNKLVSYYVTDSFGRYFFPAVQGEYLLQVDKEGFTSVKQEVSVSQENEQKENIKVDVVLK